MKRTNRARTQYDHGEPIHRTDSLPALIFFSILTLMMLLVASRMQTHALTLPLNMPLLNAPRHSIEVHRLFVSRSGIVTIDDVAILHSDLAATLRAIRHSNPHVGISFAADPNAHYPDVLTVLGAIKQAGLAGERFCFSELQPHAVFHKATDRYMLHFERVLMYDSIHRPEWKECDPRLLPPVTRQ